jgi:hypothetical protein
VVEPDPASQAWRGGPPPKSRLGEQLFALGGSWRRALLSGAVALACGAALAWIVRRDSLGSAAAWERWLAFPLAFGFVLPALEVRRQLRGQAAIWTGALELRAGGQSRFEPWDHARAWRRSQEFGDFDLIVRFARTDDAAPAGVTLTCESHAQREAIIARLIEADVDSDPWLDDPRKG